MAKRYDKVGTVLKNKKDGGKFIILGNTKNKNEQYNYSVDVRVTSSDGTVRVFKNPLIGLQDPRTKKGVDASKIPDNLVAELVITTTTEE